MSADRGQMVTVLPRSRSPVEGVNLHRVGLEIEDWVDQRRWYALGKLLQQVDYAWEWMVADWLAFGGHRYGDKVYQSATRLFGKAPRTWEDYAYVARNLRISERSEILPLLVHKPVARFGDTPALQRELLAIAEQHRLGKFAFEAVIDLYVQRKSYAHVLPSETTPLSRSRLRASRERDGVRKRALAEGGAEWLEYALEQVEAWRHLTEELARPPNRQAALGA